jgi:hypothetical protein
MSPETYIFKKLASDIAIKRNLDYSTVLGWLWYRISFALLHSAIMAIRGTRSTAYTTTTDILLAVKEGGVPQA